LERRCIGLSKRRPMRLADPSRSGRRGRQIPSPTLSSTMIGDLNWSEDV